MRNASLLALAGIVALAALPAAAQTNPHQKPGPQPRESYGSYRSEPSYSPRASTTYSHPPGYRGTIRWNTPNADGNFGGPSAGGAGVGG